MDDQTVGQYWDQNAPAWIEGVRAGYDIYRESINNPAFLALLPAIEGRTLLDVGCGEGYNTRLLADRGAQLTGVDISTKLIAAAREHEAQAPRGICYHCCSGAAMTGFQAASFDGVVSTMAMMDMPDYRGCVREVSRVLKPGGFFQFSILHPLIQIRNFRWVYDEHDVRIGAEVGDYFGLLGSSEGINVDEWKFSHVCPAYAGRVEPFKVPYFKRTLSEYFNGLTENGFQVIRLEEPFANLQAVEKYPQMADSRTLPYFLIFQCRLGAACPDGQES